MKTLEEQIKNARVSTPDFPLHRAQLRRALLSSKRFEGSPIYIMKRLIPASVLLLLILGLSFTFHPENTDHPLTTPKASAEEVLANVIEEFQSLTDEEIAALNEKLGMPCGDVLTEAREAVDLHLIEVEKTVEDGMISYIFHDEAFADGEVGIQMSEDESEIDLTFLEYTGPDGVIVQMGIRPDYIPSIIFMSQPGEVGWTVNAAEGEDGQSVVDTLTITGSEEGNLNIEDGEVNEGSEYGPMEIE